MNIDQLTVNTLRFLGAEAIQKAKSGHPGIVMGAAPAAFTVFKNMKHNPADPQWADRDRFVLSAGHGSALLYALLHVFGYPVSLEDLKDFRQLDSRTPGHPEYRHTPGVETTTGPLGQGIANAVGMALAESRLAAHFNRPDFAVVDHYTYALCGDGCLQEGVAAEAASLAGTLGLGKLIVLYDSNRITIEGDIATAFDEDVKARFAAYGWQTLKVEDGNDLTSIAAALNEAKADTARPTLIQSCTEIGYGAPHKVGKASAHGEPLGEEEIRLAKDALGWPYSESFFVPEEVRMMASVFGQAAAEREETWKTRFAKYSEVYPALAREWAEWHSPLLPKDLLDDENFWRAGEGNLATRAASEKVLQYVAGVCPNLMGGSADLGPSNKSVMKEKPYYSKQERDGANMHFGIREFAMTAIASGMAVHGGLRPYVAGFFVFSDYMKAGLRLQALMQLPVLSLLTHDSIGVGEDGPTHQPIEHLAALRSIPGYTVFRPCDGRETAAGYYTALTNPGPTALILSRQNLTDLPGTGREALQGAYVLVREEADAPDVILMATGSEVALAVEAARVLKEEGVAARVVSMPSWELFARQSPEYQEEVLPKAVRRRVAVEAASDFGWHRFIGLDGKMVGMQGFGASAPAGKLFEKFGITAEAVVAAAQELMKS